MEHWSPEAGEAGVERMEHVTKENASPDATALPRSLSELGRAAGRGREEGAVCHRGNAWCRESDRAQRNRAGTVLAQAA